MPSEKRKLGDIGEKVAEKWLMSKGYKILERNYWKKWGEIDIVAEGGEVVHFIEVKTLAVADLDSQNNYRPEENVHPGKLKRLHRAIETYILERGVEEDWQIDVAAVYLDTNRRLARVKMLENIV